MLDRPEQPTRSRVLRRRGDRRRDAEKSMEAIVSSAHRQRMKAGATAVEGTLLAHAYTGRASTTAAFDCD
jgi:hypothetical protein